MNSSHAKARILDAFLVLLFLAALTGIEQDGFAFTLSPSSHIMAGQTVYINAYIPGYFYGVYWINTFNPSDESACAYIDGADLAIDNDLTHYGTCFVNDVGTFKIIELSGVFPASFTDSKQSSLFVSTTNLTVQGSFPIPGTPTLSSPSPNDIISNRTPTFSVSCASGYTLNLFADDSKIASGVCPSSGTTSLISTSSLSYGLHFITAKQADSTGNLSIASDALAITEVLRTRRIFVTE
jgi:hypothetical protein